MNCKKNASGNPSEEKRLFNLGVEKVVEIGLERLRPFENHPFKVKEDMRPWHSLWKVLSDME